MPLRVQRADKVVAGIDAAARSEAAAVGQLVASREGGRDRATDFGGITGMNHAQSRINWHRQAAATIRQSLRRHHVVEVLEVHRWHYEGMALEAGRLNCHVDAGLPRECATLRRPPVSFS